MQFAIAQTMGGEVIVEGHSGQGRPVYHGAPAETGLWKLAIPKFESYICETLLPCSYGRSIEAFVFGLEIAELQGWGKWFETTRDYVSYRPKSKSILSVGQIEWKEVKDLPAVEQFPYLADALRRAIKQIPSATKRPKDFDDARLLADIEAALAKADAMDFLPQQVSRVDSFDQFIGLGLSADEANSFLDAEINSVGGLAYAPAYRWRKVEGISLERLEEIKEIGRANVPKDANGKPLMVQTGSIKKP